MTITEMCLTAIAIAMLVRVVYDIFVIRNMRRLEGFMLSQVAEAPEDDDEPFGGCGDPGCDACYADAGFPDRVADDLVVARGVPLGVRKVYAALTPESIDPGDTVAMRVTVQRPMAVERFMMDDGFVPKSMHIGVEPVSFVRLAPGIEDGGEVNVYALALPTFARVGYDIVIHVKNESDSVRTASVAVIGSAELERRA